MDDTQQIPVIGVVGGIGAGKSFFTQTLAKWKNVAIVDADAVGHAVLLLPEVRQRLQARFGPQILTAEGHINRRALAQIVFGPAPEHRQAKLDLEAVVHPLIAAEIQRQITTLQHSHTAEAILLDAAILLETGWRQMCNAIVYVDAPLEIRRQRVLTTRGWSPAELEAREANQLPLAEKRAAADYFLENVGPPDLVTERCLQVYSKIMDGHSPQHRTL